MKKFFCLSFILTTLLLFSNISFAAFPAGDLGDPISVVADFRNSAIDELTIEFFNISDDSKLESNQINWKIQDIQFPKKDLSDQWKWSTTYAVIKATVTDPTVSYYLYQKNTESTVYKSTAPRINEDPETHEQYTVYNGLVNKDLQGGDYGGYIPLNYLITANKLSSSDLQKTYDPDVLTGDKASRYFIDKADSNFDAKYTIIACANSGGIALYPYDEGGYNPWSPESIQESKTAYIYFGGDFITLLRDYPDFGTDQIYIEKVIE